MSSVSKRAALVVAALLATASAATAQPRPYIGYVYPAGGQQGATFQVKLGGQNLDGVHGVIVSGRGASGKLISYLRRIGPIGRPVDAPATGAGGLGMSRKANSSGPARFRPMTAR